jgi:hypothetical protein
MLGLMYLSKQINKKWKHLTVVSGEMKTTYMAASTLSAGL